MRLSCTICLMIAVLCTGGASAIAAEVAHPRLLITPQRLAEIRTQIAIEGSSHQLAYQAMKVRVEQDDPVEAYFGRNRSYAPGYQAREAAFLSLLSEDAAQKKRYADKAHKMLMGGAKGSRTLGRSMYARNLALAYDWAWPAWTPQQREAADKQVKTNLAAMAKITHSNLGGDRSSNFVGVIRGAEMLLLLASGEGPGHERYGFLKKELVRHIRDGFGSLGASTEGMGYAEYPGGFLYPAVFACESVGDDDLLKLARGKNTPALVMYADTFIGLRPKFIQYGVAHYSNFNEGYASAMLHLADQEQLPYLLWWYDRHMGRLSRMEKNDAFDGHRAGTTLAMLYYPQDVTPKDPTGVYPKGVADRMGYHFFRNRWNDENDILVSIASAQHHHEKGWWQHEEFAINLMAYGTQFIGGPAKARGAEVYSSLLVDGEYATKDMKRELDGALIHSQVDDDGGYVLAGGGAFYQARGLDKAQRHMLVKFSDPKQNTAIIATLDDVAAPESHTYTWQANLGNEQDDGGVKPTTGSEAGRLTITLHGANGWVKAWVLHPADATVTLGDPSKQPAKNANLPASVQDMVKKDPLRISTKGANAKIWVVMHVGSGKAPTASITGSGMDSVLKVAGVTVKWDAARNRIVAE